MKLRERKQATESTGTPKKGSPVVEHVEKTPSRGRRRAKDDEVSTPTKQSPSKGSKKEAVKPTTPSPPKTKTKRKTRSKTPVSKSTSPSTRKRATGEGGSPRTVTRRKRSPELQVNLTKKKQQQNTSPLLGAFFIFCVISLWIASSFLTAVN